MAAPKSVYKKSFNIPYANSDGTMTTTSILLASQLASYGATKEAIMGKFKLDIILPRKDDNAFLGGVIEGSDNYHYHNTSRISKGRVYYNGEYLLLNDSGLNIKPDVVFDNIPNLKTASPVLLWGGRHSLVRAIWKSAMYSNTTSMTITINGEELPLRYEGNTMLQGKQQTVQFEHSAYLNEGQSYDVILRITNEEGTTEKSITASCGAEVSTPTLYDMYESASDVSDYSNSTQVDVIMFTSEMAGLSNLTEVDSATGIYGYTDYRMNELSSIENNLIPDGFYDSLERETIADIIYGKFYKVVNGEFRAYVKLAVGRPVYCTLTPVVYNGYIHILISGKDLTQQVTLSHIYYYTDVNNPNSIGTVSLGATLQPDKFTYPVGSMIRTSRKFTPPSEAGAWAVIISGTGISDIRTPIVEIGSSGSSVESEDYLEK